MDHAVISDDRRRAPRVDVAHPVSIVAGDRQWAGTTVNVSQSGLLVATEGELTIWAGATVTLPGLGDRAVRVVRRDGERYGMLFREALGADAFVALTGVPLPEEEATPADPAPAPRVAPAAFGRDKVKGFLRRTGELVDAGRRR